MSCIKWDIEKNQHPVLVAFKSIVLIDVLSYSGSDDAIATSQHKLDTLFVGHLAEEGEWQWWR